MPYTAQEEKLNEKEKKKRTKKNFIYLYFIPSPSSHCTYKREEMSIAKSTEVRRKYRTRDEDEKKDEFWGRLN